MQRAKTNLPAWEVRATDASAVDALVSSLAVSPLVARLLVNRKLVDVRDAKRFLETDIAHVHDPFLMKDMDVAATRVAAAIRSGEKICVYGDYDVDGAVATSMLILYFAEVGGNADFYIPNRLFEGYSLNRAALDTIKSRGDSLLITVDNGIMAVNEVAYAQSIGLDVVVTDHHKTGDVLPHAVAVVNPQRVDCAYPFKGICGAGVAFKLMLAVRLKLRDAGWFVSRAEPNLKNYLDLLCVPTVCDVVPLVDENRFFVKEGLKHLARTQRPGLKALLKVCGLEGKELSSYDLGFKLGPRINACGRLVEASLGVRMLTSGDFAEALGLAVELDRLNQERRDLEKTITEEAFARIATDYANGLARGVTVFDPSWHVGVVGIVASRLVEKLHRPVFVLARAENGLIKGSGRSIAGVNLVAALKDCESLLQVYGGHEAAAGVTLSPENVPAFRIAFDEAVAKQTSPESFLKKTWVDGEIAFADISEKMLSEIESLEPFGMGNAKPVFAARALEIASKRVVGEHHLKLKLASGGKTLDAIAFNKSAEFDRLSSVTGLLFGVELNEYNGKASVQLVVKDFFDAEH